MGTCVCVVVFVCVGERQKSVNSASKMFFVHAAYCVFHVVYVVVPFVLSCCYSLAGIILLS